MKQVPQSQSGIFSTRVIGAFLLCSAGVFLAMFGFAAAIPDRKAQSPSERPNELSAVSPPVPRFRPDSKSTRKNFVAQTDTGWSVVSSPNINIANTLPNSLSSVACASAADCWAVGSGDHGVLLMHWDGSSWLFDNSLDITFPTYDYLLYAIACPSGSDCWAVGMHNTYGAGGLVVHWDGNTWTQVPSPTTAFRLSDVTCNSSSDCWAVGNSYDYATELYQTVIEHWDGNSWMVVTSPNAATNQSNVLIGVTCNLASDCWAVGNGNGRTLTEHWNGNAWTIVTSPGQSEGLESVDCTLASDCWAVGSLIEHWDGTSWNVVAAPLASSALSSVSCTSQSDCWAVGRDMMAHWDGNVWSVISGPPSGAYLYDVTCTSASDCWSVGFTYNNHAQTFTEHWDGVTWQIIASPNYGDTQDNVLSSVGCASESDCWSVGYSSGDSFIQRWNGNSWTIVAAPRNSSGGSEALSNVICTSASECWSTGNGEYEFHINYPGTYYGTFIDRWNGSSWSISTTPYFFPGTYTKLNSVACASPSDCWAVGDGYALIMHWNGSSWSYIAAAPLDPGFVGLNGVTCSSASECWAVGSAAHSANNYVERTLIERWDGAGWAVISSPNTSDTQPNTLTNVACASGSDCWAVGYYVDGNGKHQALIERWNGTSWAIVPSPSNGTQDNRLNGVTCALATDCRAVGSYINNFGVSQTLIEQWDGTSWSVISSPNTSSTTSNQLNGITCASASDCWAVGTYRDNTNTAQTLIEHWTPPVKLVSAVSRKSHGSAGAFDINLPLTRKPGIECRSGGPTSSYQVIATFGPAVTMTAASVVFGTGNVDSTTVNGSRITLDLSGVMNGQIIVIRLTGVNDGTASGNIDVPMGVLLGDITGNGLVNAGDVGAVKKWTGQPVSAFGFREDANANGVINSSDLAAVKAASGTALP